MGIMNEQRPIQDSIERVRVRKEELWQYSKY